MSVEMYAYAVARIRTKEMELLTKQDMEQLLITKTYDEAKRLLSEKGYGVNESEAVEELFVREREKTFDLIEELIKDMSVFHVFLCGNDYHNLKAAIKEICTRSNVPGIYSNNGTIDPAKIKEALSESNYEILPEDMRSCAKEAFEVLLKTKDAQLSDVIIDKASLEAMDKAAKKSKNELLIDYANHKIVQADIKIALRSEKTGQSYEFLDRALVESSVLDIKELKLCALSGEEAIHEYLKKTSYSDAVPHLKKSMWEFDKWCDDYFMEKLKPQKYNPFTLSPIIAYFLAKENEIKSIRILLSGKRNMLSEDVIRERLREMYV